jgi:hypothetical protein
MSLHSKHPRHGRRAVALGSAAAVVAATMFAGMAAYAEDGDPGPGPNTSGKQGPALEDAPPEELAPQSIAPDAVEPQAVGTVEYVSPLHKFTLDDVIGNALGETDADNPNVIKDGDEGETLTGEDLITKDGSVLLPINSNFGFDVQDFVGATDKEFDNVAEEGWVGQLTPDGGLQFSNADTAVLKSGNLIGTWAAGLGGSEVKASTEHFNVMEAVLTCYQTVPYDYWASAEDYADGLPSVPSLQDMTVCANNQLPNPATQAEIADAINQLEPNEDSVIPSPTDLYLGSNYSITKKDDGKLLFRWGQAVKRPIDIRFGAHIPLPEEWATAEGKGYKVTRAELVVNHAVTNNPNDQIRPEDWENEAATGLLPQYTVDSDGKWLSTRDCYEGDGNFIPEGTVLKDPAKAIEGAQTEDLAEGYSNAWYTTIHRDPFEWAYKTVDGTMVGSRTPDDSLGDLVSGPRWRLLSNKFGQDIPSLEIPATACDAPPYEKGTVKYVVGDTVTTTINLLDWGTEAEDDRWADDEAYSPFAYSSGWMTTWSGQDTVEGQINYDGDELRCDSTNDDGNCVTDLGTVLTDDFDVSFYVKGDKKPLKVYDVQLRLEYETDEVPEPTLDYGDAPASYGTESLARTVGDTYLGAAVDAELEALVSEDAMGDDNDGIDDEDGVTFPALTAGETAEATVTATGGTLDVMVDWNADGDFDDDGELTAGIATVAGDNTVPLAVPVHAAGDTFARFVLTGADDVGEIEDHAVTVTAYDTDFGDAPQSYDGDDPAAHVVSDLAMGLVDTEEAPHWSDDALGDDQAGIDDGDGVKFSKFTAGKKSVLRVKATGAGVLNLWVDWDLNGVFDSGEQAVTDQVLKAGTNAVVVVAPANLTEGASFMRLRLSPDSGVGATSTVIGGEVEDHAVTLATRAPRGQN